MKLMILDGNSIVNRAFYGNKLLTTKDGRTFVKEMDPIELKGSVEHRYTREELIHKFKTLSKMSITEFPEGTLDTLIDNILNLEKSDDVLRDIVFTLTPNRE